MAGSFVTLAALTTRLKSAVRSLGVLAGFGDFFPGLALALDIAIVSS